MPHQEHIYSWCISAYLLRNVNSEKYGQPYQLALSVPENCKDKRKLRGRYMKGNRELPSAWFSSVRPRCKGRKLAGGPKGEGGRCGERAVCEELGETKWTDADSEDMASMSPQGLIHGTACGSGEGTPKKLSEPAISRRANDANQEEWFGQIPIPLAAGVRMHFKKLPPAICWCSNIPKAEDIPSKRFLESRITWAQ